MLVYLSYSRPDIVIAEVIAKRLESVGIRVFRDNEISVGESWESKIQSKLTEADLVIVLWTEASVISPLVKAEADFAVRQDKLFPILLEPAEIPIQFAKFNTLRITSQELQKRDLDIAEIVRERISSRLRGTTTKEQPSRKSASLRPTGLESIVDFDAAAESVGDTIEYDKAKYTRPRGASSASIFVAHASADKPKLKPIIEGLLESGFRLWVDKPQNIGLSDYHARLLAKSRIRFEGDWKEQINQAARRATKILACWSKDAIQGRREQFHYEVYMGLISQKLTQCRIDEVSELDIGFPYNFGQVADLSTFSDGKYLFEFQYMMDDLASKKRTRLLPS
jgi:hypothetical protein